MAQRQRTVGLGLRYAWESERGPPSSHAYVPPCSAGIPSDEYFCYVCECVWNIQENPDADPCEAFRRDMPRTTVATKKALFEETKRLDAHMKAKFQSKPQGTVNKNYVSDGLLLTPRTRIARAKHVSTHSSNLA